MKYIPGPWRIKPLKGKYYGTKIELSDGNVMELWTDPKKYMPDEISPRELEKGWEPDWGWDHVECAECYATAVLISKAPELVERLQALVGASHHVMEWDDAAVDPDFEKAVTDAIQLLKQINHE